MFCAIDSRCKSPWHKRMLLSDFQKLKEGLTRPQQGRCWVAESDPTLSDPVDCSTPGFPVLQYLQEFAQTHVHWVGQWCHPSISSSVTPFSSCPQSFPASESFPVSKLFISGGQSIEASASILPMNIEDWFPLGWTGWIFLLFKEHSSLSSTTVWKHRILGEGRGNLWLERSQPGMA